MLSNFPSKINLDRFDVIITHYSLSLGPMIDYYLGKELIQKLRNFKGLKIAFLQDEYRQLNTYWKNLNELDIDILFSCVPLIEIKKVYPIKEVPNLRVVNVLTGYIPTSFLKQKKIPISKRHIDVGYRTRKTPFWLGRLGYEKYFISDEFEIRSKSYKLNTSLSSKEGDRLYGKKWINFINSCRTLLGVESGSSIVDFDGSIEKKVESYVAKNPTASFDEVFDKFLKKIDGNVNLHQISPRCFEAIALKTPLILFEGKYSGILKKNKHYISLKKDFSNFDDVVKKINDHSYLQKIANRAYNDIALDPKLSYKYFINKIDKIIDIEFKKRKKNITNKPYTYNEFKNDINSSFLYIIISKLTLFFQSILLGNQMLRSFTFYVWEKTPSWGQRLIRPLAKIISR